MTSALCRRIGVRHKSAVIKEGGGGGVGNTPNGKGNENSLNDKCESQSSTNSDNSLTNTLAYPTSVKSVDRATRVARVADYSSFLSESGDEANMPDKLYVYRQQRRRVTTRKMRRWPLNTESIS